MSSFIVSATFGNQLDQAIRDVICGLDVEGDERKRERDRPVSV